MNLMNIEVEQVENILAVLRVTREDLGPDKLMDATIETVENRLKAHKDADPATDEAYRAAANQEWANDDCEIDEDAMVSIGEGGAFVQAWVWVSDSDR